MIKNTKIIITVCLVLGAAFGYLIGNLIGTSNGYRAQVQVQKSKSIAELRSELKEVESRTILNLLEGSSEVKRIDEGGLFKTKYVHYLHGKISNNAAVASVKDIKLRIDFFAKTDSKVSSDELVLYEFIQPNQQYSFKQKINWPSEATTYSLKIIEAIAN